MTVGLAWACATLTRHSSLKVSEQMLGLSCNLAHTLLKMALYNKAKQPDSNPSSLTTCTNRLQLQTIGNCCTKAANGTGTTSAV